MESSQTALCVAHACGLDAAFLAATEHTSSCCNSSVLVAQQCPPSCLQPTSHLPTFTPICPWRAFITSRFHDFLGLPTWLRCRFFPRQESSGQTTGPWMRLIMPGHRWTSMPPSRGRTQTCSVERLPSCFGCWSGSALRPSMPQA